MQNTYASWRASNPLVFITIHLLLGIFLSHWLPHFSNTVTNLIVISTLIISILLLWLLLLIGKTKALTTILLLIILICWGIIIKLAAQYHAIFSIQYPEQFIKTCSNFVVEKINKTITTKEANGFALAILLGIKVDMDKSLMSAYAQLGIIHIIAISGMHLEILFKNLERITNYLPRKRIFIILELIILLFAVWIYTLMAFASPSIVRASLFFSIYIIGKFIGANRYMLNTIAAGIFILMLFNVNDLSNIGLQLSYAAVIGIHLFYKQFYKSLDINNPIIQFLWSNCCMSLSVQLTTFPILAYHFHKIAGWVLVSNFIMVPLSNLILYGLGILLLLPIQFSITLFWGKIVEQYILFFNHFVQNWFLHTKAQTIQISMNGIQILIYYLILLFLYLWLYLKQTKWLLAIFGIISIHIILKLFS
jgi:competence protein ComEC